MQKRVSFKYLIHCVGLVLALHAHSQTTPFLNVPISGEQGVDWIIVNYVDWEATGHTDAYCGSKCYDGHEGTDFTLLSFPQMDDGVYVLAAADGVVTYVIDSLFDREKESVVSKGLGNYIAVAHNNDYYTYYGHLKKYSALFEPGDEVKMGDTIAQVGSSGNSTDPHLHFEVWYDSLYVVDPFEGPCGNSTSLWLTTPLYETDLHVWDYGMHNIEIDLDDLRERVTSTNCCPFTFPQNSSTPVLFWAHLSGIRKDDILRIDWYNPDGILWFSFDVTLDRDYWYYYYWSFINNENLTRGSWTAELFLNGQRIIEQPFRVDFTSGFYQASDSSCEKFSVASDLDVWNENYRVWSLNGRVIETERQLQSLPAQVVLIQNNLGCMRKWFWPGY